jgi:hypothetical protein
MRRVEPMQPPAERAHRFRKFALASRLAAARLRMHDGPAYRSSVDICVRDIFGFHADASGERDHERRTKRQVRRSTRAVVRHLMPEQQA